MLIFDRDGNELTDFDISEKQQSILAASGQIVIRFHTPQLFRSLLGEHTGSVILRKIGAHIVAMDADSMKKCADMLQAVKKARAQP